MKKYKNKTLYRLISIKATVYIFFHIFIRAAAGQMCPKQDFIVVPPASNIMEVKQKNTIGVKKMTLIKLK